MTNILVAIGANHSPRASDLTATIQSSLTALEEHYSFTVCQVSRMYRTKAFPVGSGPDFINAVATLEAALPSIEILHIFHRVEEAFGRNRDVRWGPRTLDLDLLGHGDEILPDKSTVLSWMNATPVDGVIAAPDELILPHPRLHERAFVLVPAQDVAPNWNHPILGQPISKILENLPEGDRESVKVLD